MTAAFLPFILAQAAPRDLTPKNAIAREYLAYAYDFAASAKLPSLSQHQLPKGDVEVRYWGGFAWGTHVLILRQHSGNRTVVCLDGSDQKCPTPLPAPKLGWPTFWAKAEKLGLFTLPDQEQAGSKKGYHEIADGYSNLVEYQKEGAYRAYAYDNAVNQPEWPPAKPMAALDTFIESQFPR